MHKFLLVILLSFTFTKAFPIETWGADETKIIKLGFNIPITGTNPDVGTSSKNAAEMFLKKNKSIKVGKQSYRLQFIYADNQYKPAVALKVVTQLIKKEDVLGLIGPQASSQAVPAGEIANDFTTPMISPWSTNPQTTRNRPYVFRGAYIDPFQAPVLTVFASTELSAKTAAVLYDIDAAYSRGLAEYFKFAFENLLGKGSVVAFESFHTGEKDFSNQLFKIITSKPDVLFVPQYYTEVPLIVKSAQDMGWTKPIMGSDSWGGGDLLKSCDQQCKGYFFTTHYTAIGAEGKTKKFIDDYKEIYGKIPDDVAALTWDSLGLMIQAIKDTGGLNHDIKADRIKVKNSLAKVQNFHGVTGRISMTPSGDPRKCVVILRIDETNELKFYQSVCPR